MKILTDFNRIIELFSKKMLGLLLYLPMLMLDFYYIELRMKLN